MHLTLLGSSVVVGFGLLVASAACSRRFPTQVVNAGSADAVDNSRRARTGRDAGLADAGWQSSTTLEQVGEVDSNGALDAGGAVEQNATLTFDAASDSDLEPSDESTQGGDSEMGRGPDGELEDGDLGPPARDAQAPETANFNPAPGGEQADAGATTCLSGSDVSAVGCDSILQTCPFDTELVVLCFTIWNKSRSQVMQGTLGCFENYGCNPGAAQALDECFQESSQRACIEDRADCSELADTCSLLTKASCENALAPFHDSIREKTLTCVRDHAAAPSGSNASCLESFEGCLNEVSSPVTL
jgi:hypothetical protein